MNKLTQEDPRLPDPKRKQRLCQFCLVLLGFWFDHQLPRPSCGCSHVKAPLSEPYVMEFTSWELPTIAGPRMESTCSTLQQGSSDKSYLSPVNPAPQMTNPDAFGLSRRVLIVFTFWRQRKLWLRGRLSFVRSLPAIGHSFAVQHTSETPHLRSAYPCLSIMGFWLKRRCSSKTLVCDSSMVVRMSYSQHNLG